MIRKVISAVSRIPTDDKQEDITETRVWKLLEHWHEEYEGNGLTANAICYLTNQSWPIVRSVLTRGGEHQITGMYCYDVHAPVFYVQEYCGKDSISILERNQDLLKRSDAIIKKYPPPTYQGATADAGQKKLTFAMIGRYDDDEHERCDDPECCKPLTKHEEKLKANRLAKENLVVVRELKQSWR